MKKIVCMIMMFSMLFMTGCWKVSDGERTGTLTKFSNKGLIVKTWEGEMILGGIGSSGSGSNTWKFTCEDGNTIKSLSDVNGKIITVKYEEEFITAPWRADTNYFITEVK